MVIVLIRVELSIFNQNEVKNLMSPWPYYPCTNGRKTEMVQIATVD